MAMFDGGVLQEYRLIDLSKSKEETDTRITTMGGNILKNLDEWSPSMVCIEAPQGHGKNVELVRKISELLGIVRGWCINNTATFREVTPSVWRKRVGLKQGATKREELKQESVEYVLNKYGIDVIDDIADAICIGDAMI